MGQLTIYVDSHIFDIALEAWQGPDQIFYKAKAFGKEDLDATPDKEQELFSYTFLIKNNNWADVYNFSVAGPNADLNMLVFTELKQPLVLGIRDYMDSKKSSSS
jgi:hypothetical protein